MRKILLYPKNKENNWSNSMHKLILFPSAQWEKGHKNHDYSALFPPNSFQIPRVLAGKRIKNALKFDSVIWIASS